MSDENPHFRRLRPNFSAGDLDSGGEVELLVGIAHSFQKSLIGEPALNHIRILSIVYSIFLN